MPFPDHLHPHQWPPQNELGNLISGPGPRTSECKEPQLHETKSIFPPNQQLGSHLNHAPRQEDSFQFQTIVQNKREHCRHIQTISGTIESNHQITH
jgi:hypothetical protein